MDDPFVERLIEKSLARLGESEPEPGLEMRLLTRLRSESAAADAWPRGWKLRLALAVVAAFAVSAAIFFYSVKGRQAAEPTFRSASAGQKPGAVAHGERRAVTHGAMIPGRAAQAKIVRSEGQHSERAAAEPRLSVFPSPAPMTEEEKLLIAYTRHGAPPNPHPFKEQMERLVKLGLAPASQDQPDDELSKRRN